LSCLVVDERDVGWSKSDLRYDAGTTQ
jgi:hypothetical protein